MWYTKEQSPTNTPNGPKSFAVVWFLFEAIIQMAIPIPINAKLDQVFAGSVIHPQTVASHHFTFGFAISLSSYQGH